MKRVRIWGTRLADVTADVYKIVLARSRFLTGGGYEYFFSFGGAAGRSGRDPRRLRSVRSLGGWLDSVVNPLRDFAHVFVLVFHQINVLLVMFSGIILFVVAPIGVREI